MECSESSLFDGCVRVVLGSVDLLRKATIFLPKVVAQYILYRACNSTDAEAVEVVVRSWPHPDLSLDFMLNPFCRSHEERSKSCIKAHSYYKTLSTDEYAECIPCIALGLFNKLHTDLEKSDVSILREVDLGMVRIAECDGGQIVYCLCKLIGGEFPVRHYSDYIGPTDRKAFPFSKPTLSPDISRKILLKVNIMIRCPDVMLTLHESVSNSIHFEVVYCGMGFSSLFAPRKALKAMNYCFCQLHLDSMVVPTGIIRSADKIKLPYLTANGTLWLNMEYTLSQNLYQVFLSRVLNHSNSIRLVVTHLDANFLAAIIFKNYRVTCFTLLNCQYKQTIEDAKGSMFTDFLSHNAHTLEYIELQHRLTSLPLESLQKCTNLRVLVMTAVSTVSSHRPVGAAQIFLAIKHLNSLEYFEWSESLNIITKDVLDLYNLLSNYLPNLLHWHWKLCHLLLFTTDLGNLAFEPLEALLSMLLAGKNASLWCETFKFTLDNCHFKHWLETIRPQVCFVTVSEMSRSPVFPM